MWKEFSLLMLSLSLLMECSQGFSVDSSSLTSLAEESIALAEISSSTHAENTDENVATNPLEEQISDHLNVLLMTLKDFYLLTYSALESGAELFRNTIANAASEETQSEELKAKSETLFNFTEKVKHFYPREDYHFDKHFEMLDEYIKLLENFNATAMEQPSTEDLLLDERLRKNDLETLNAVMADSFSSYLDVLTNKVETFEKLLSDNKDSVKEETRKWVDEMKLQYLLKKIEGYAQFFAAQHL